MGGGRKSLKNMPEYSEKTAREKYRGLFSEITREIISDSAIGLMIDVITTFDPPIGISLRLIKEAYDFYGKFSEELRRSQSMTEAFRNAAVRYASGKITGELVAQMAELYVDKEFTNEAKYFIKKSIVEVIESTTSKVTDMVFKHALGDGNEK